MDIKNLSANLAVNRLIEKNKNQKKHIFFFAYSFFLHWSAFPNTRHLQKKNALFVLRLQIKETKSTNLLCSHLLLSSLLLSPSPLVSSHRFRHVLSVAELSELVAETGH